MTASWELALQDVMRLDNQARMNTPGKAAGNWAWRVGDASVSTAFVYAALLVPRQSLAAMIPWLPGMFGYTMAKRLTRDSSPCPGLEQDVEGGG